MRSWPSGDAHRAGTLEPKRPDSVRSPGCCGAQQALLPGLATPPSRAGVSSALGQPGQMQRGCQGICSQLEGDPFFLALALARSGPNTLSVLSRSAPPWAGAHPRDPPLCRNRPRLSSSPRVGTRGSGDIEWLRRGPCPSVSPGQGCSMPAGLSHRQPPGKASAAPALSCWEAGPLGPWVGLSPPSGEAPGWCQLVVPLQSSRAPREGQPRPASRRSLPAPSFPSPGSFSTGRSSGYLSGTFPRDACESGLVFRVAI